MSNNELREIISKLQNSNEDLSEANMELIRNYELTKEELEKSINENSNLKGIILLKERKIEELNYTINEQKNSMNQMEEMLHNSEKKINYLQTIENSSKQTEKDNLDIISNLKEAIENIQKNGENYDKDIEKLNNKIYQLMDIINYREKEIANLNYKINTKDNE
jgi:chromosome segregation ATPase